MADTCTSISSHMTSKTENTWLSQNVDRAVSWDNSNIGMSPRKPGLEHVQREMKEIYSVFTRWLEF